MHDKESQLKALIKELEKIRGRHTELVTVYVPAGFSLNKVVEQIRSEQGTSQNIKSKAVRKNVTGALEKILQHLKLYRQTPGNGMVIFAGNVSDKEGVADLEIWAVEPPEPLKTRLYRCDQRFLMDPLKEMVREREIYGLIVLDKSDAAIGVVMGKKIEKLKEMDSVVPGKTKAGGWCVQGDTLLQLSDGRLRRIEDIGDDDFMCYDFKKMGVSRSRHNHYFSRESSNALEVTTQYPAFRIRTTPEHKFFVAGSSGFEEKSAGKLDSNDRLIIVKRAGLRGKKTGINADIPKSHSVSREGARFLFRKRDSLGLYQKQVADKLGVSQTAISKFELGERQLKKENLESILDLYGIDRRGFFKRFVKTTNSIKFPGYMNHELAQILGYMLGDGNAESQRIAISESDSRLVRHYQKMIEKLFGVTTSLKERKGKGYWQLRINSVPLLGIIRRNFPGILDPDMRMIPDYVCMAGDDALSGFIRGLFDAEGYVVPSNNSIGITMNGLGVMRELQMLLLRFGIVSSFREISSKGSYAKKQRYSLIVTDYNSVRNYAEHIGFSSERKSRILRQVSRKSEVTRTDQIPIRGSHVMQLVKRIGLTTEDFPRTGSVFFSDKRNMSYRIFRERIVPAIEKRISELETRESNIKKLRVILRIKYKDIAEEMGVTKSTVFGNLKNGWNTREIRKVLESRRMCMLREAMSIRNIFTDVLNSDLISAKVKSVEKVKPEGLYYDMEIPVFSNFVANGFVLHNSQARYARVREGLLNDFLKKVGDVASSTFREFSDMQGIIVAGPGPIKEQFAEGEFLHYEIKKKILGIVNTSYTGEYGLREAVERGEELISEASITKERKILERFFDEFGKDSGLAIYGFNEVLEALESGNLEMLIISEDFDWVRADLECDCGFSVKKVLDRKQLDSQKCPECNAKMRVTGEKELTEELIKLAEQMSTTVEVVSSTTVRGEQIKELGGIVGILRYKS